MSPTPPPASPFRDVDRPRAPVHPAAVTTAAGRHGQAALVGIHAHLRAEMAQVVRAVRAAVTDARRAADARALINDLTMGVNYRALGSFCGRHCSVVDLHHRIEDASMFPHLAQADAELRPVLDRLSHEHEVIHAVLVRLDDLLVDLAQGSLQAAGPVSLALAELEDGLLSHLAYEEQELPPNAKGKIEKRTVLHLDPRLAPVKVAVLPLSRNEALSPLARQIGDELRGSWNIDFDDSGAIGRRYRRQDEIGTPYCVTVDFDSLEDNAVTVRERDTMSQERVSLDNIEAYLAGKLLGAA